MAQNKGSVPDFSYQNSFSSIQFLALWKLPKWKLPKWKFPNERWLKWKIPNSESFLGMKDAQI